MRRFFDYSVFLVLIYVLFVVNAATLAYQVINSSGEVLETPLYNPEAQTELADSSNSTQVSIADDGFAPAVITVTLGSEVIWINDGSERHGVESVVQEPEDFTVFLPIVLKGPASGPDWATSLTGVTQLDQLPQPWSSGPLQPGGTFRKSFNQLGTFPYFNPFHPDIEGAVVVVSPNQAPTIQITSPTTGDNLGPGSLQVSGEVNDDRSGLMVKINGVEAIVAGNTFNATISLPAGNQTIQATVHDAESLTALDSIVVYVDGEPPEIDIISPKHRQSVYTGQPDIVAHYDDFGSQVDLSSVNVLLQERGASELDITSGLVITPSGLSGQPPAPLNGDTVYTLTIELSDSFGNATSHAASFYVPENPGSIQPPTSSDQSGWVTGRVFDSSTCDPDLVTCQGLAGAQVTLESVDVQLISAVRQQRQNQVFSKLFSEEPFTALDPLTGSVATTPVSGVIFTGPDGFFAFPADSTGVYWVRVEKEGYTYGQREMDIVREQSAATNAIYLTPEDSAVTPCDDAGCDHINSNDTLRLDIPEGAIPGGTTVNLRATWFSNVEFLPSGELPPGTNETYAFDLSAGSEITFTTPVTVQVRNERGFQPGTPIPVGYWNQFTQEWEHAGVSVVDPTGNWLVFTTTHFSPFDPNMPLFPPDVEVVFDQEQPDEPDNQDPSAGGADDKKDEPCNDGSSGCFVGLKSGVLQEWIDFPTVEVLGQSEAPRMNYSTGRAQRTELIDARVVMDNLGTSFLKDYITFELFIAGEKTEIHYIPIMTDTLGELGRFRYLWDGVDAQGEPMPPGIYEYTVKFIIPYTAEYCRAQGNIFGAPPECAAPLGVFADGEIELMTSGAVILDGESGSAYGEGWVIQGQQRLYENERGRIVIMDGIRHDEFYFPQKDLLLAAKESETTSAADRVALLQRSTPVGGATLNEVDSPITTTSEDLLRPVPPELLPEADLSLPENLSPYTEIPSPDGTATSVCGSLNGSNSWAIDVIVTCDVIVENGAVLDIEAGVKVQFQTGTSLFVAGALNAHGSEASSVTFQAETGNQPGTWRQISFLPGSTGDLSHITVEHGGNFPNSAILGAITIGSSQVAIENSVFQNNQTAVFISNASPTISGTTFYSNTATYGAAIYLQNNASTTLENSRFQENQAAFVGGAIYAQESSVAITNSEFLTNTANNDGGGIYISYGTATILDSLFSGNSTQNGSGGGAYIVNGDLEEPSLVADNSFILNQADNGGGGGLSNDSFNNTIRGNHFISNTASSGGALTDYGYSDLPGFNLFAENIFRGNHAQHAGAMLIFLGNPLLVNNIFASNTSDFDAGALSVNSRAYVEHNVFWDNTAAYGGAIINNAWDAIPVLTNNIIVSNTATQANGGGAISSGGIDGVPFGDYNIVWGNSEPQYYFATPGDHDIQANPMLANPSIMDFHLLPGSPAIDAGSWFIRSDNDVEGDMRPMGDRPDIGIDETLAFGLNIHGFPRSIEPGKTTSYTLELFNPDGQSRTAILSHTLPLESSLLAIDGGPFTCLHDGAALGGTVNCEGSIPGVSQEAINITIETNDALQNPVLQHTVAEALANGHQAQDRADGWLEWCYAQINEESITTDLAAAISDADDADLVKVSGRCLVGEPLDIRNDIILQGSWDRSFAHHQLEIYTTTLDGDFSEAILETSDNPVIEGFSIIHGFDQSDGVVMFTSGSSAIFQYNEVAHNIGSGIHTRNDSATIQDNNIHHNQGYYYGGGIYTRSTLNFIRNNRIHHNTTGENGGGIYLERAGTLQNNILTENTAGSDGGGLYFDGYAFVPVTVEYNVLYNNDASLGGGLAIRATQYDLDSVFRNNIVVSNTATTGGGVYINAPFDGFRFNNVWNNQASDYAGAGAPGPNPSSNLYPSLDPMFEDPDNGDFHLRTDSPMIDIGDPLSNFIPDFEGDPRPLGERVDIGADEYRSLAAFSRTSTDYSRLEFDLVEESFVRIYPDQTRVVFDDQNRHARTLAPDGKQTSYTYHPDGSIAAISITAPGESAPRWVWTFNYLDGRLESIVDPAGRITDVTIDQNNHLTGVTFPDSSERSFFYDSQGLLTQQIDQNGHQTDYGYDQHGRNRLILYPAREVFDPLAGTSSIIRESRVITPSDTAYLLLNDSLPGSRNAPGDPAPTSEQLVDGISFGRGTLSGTTDRWGFLIIQNDGLGRETYHQRYTSGLTKSTEFPDGDCVEYKYNRDGQVTQETWMPPDQCDLEEDARDEDRLLVWQWTYDERFSQRKTVTDPEGRTTTTIYDYETGAGDAGNPVEIIYPLVDDGTGVLTNPVRHFTYNQWGQIETEADPLGTITRYEYTQGTPAEAAGGLDPRFKAGVDPVPGLLTKVIQDHGGENLVTSYLDYDAAGNPGQVIGPGGLLVTTYQYDAMNRLVQETDAVGTVIAYAYDGHGNQVEKVVDPGGFNIVTTNAYDPNDELIWQQVDDGLNLVSESLHYDINSMLALQVDARGGETTFLYDAADQLTNKIDPEGYVYTYTYNLDGNLATEQDPSGSIKRFLYDNFSRRIEEIVDDNGLSLSTTYEYDSVGNLISQVAPDGTKTCYQYDDLDRKISEILDCAGLNLETTFAYDLNGNVLAEVNYRGVTTGDAYDALNREIEKVLDEGGLQLEAQFTYDPAGNLEKITDYRGTETEHHYDALNRPVQVCQDANGLNQCVSYTYDALGNVASTIDGEGNVTENSYNGFSLLLESVEDADGLARTTRNTYDNTLNLVSTTDDNGNATHYSYNQRNQLIETRYADGTAVTMTYEGRGLLWTSNDQQGVTITNHYDGAGRQTAKSFSSGGSQTYEYDLASRIVVAEDTLSGNGSRVSIDFNPVHNIVAITETLDAKSWRTDYEYDYQAGTYTITYPSGEARIFDLDPLERTELVAKSGGQNIASFTYQDNLGLESRNDANGVSATTTLDTLYRPVNITSSLADYHYGYDAANNRLYRQRADLPGTPAQVYQYNTLYQVTNSWYGADDTDPTGITTFDRLVDYQQDKLSNRLSVQEDGLTENYGPTDGTSLINPMNRYESVGAQDLLYDVKGNLVDDGAVVYEYDSLNRQIAANGPNIESRYIFNALNWRVGKVVTTTSGTTKTYFIHDLNGQVLEERDGGDALLARFTYAQGIDQPLTMERGGETYYYHRDAQGSITEISDELGQLVESIDYDIYGQATIKDGSGSLLSASAFGNPYLYTGRRLDTESGNYYFRARMYDPHTGRFMQMDPAGYIDGSNLYASYFVINSTDPSGMESGETTVTLFQYSKYKGWGGGVSVSYIQKFTDCCRDGIKVTDGKRKYTVKIAAELGYAYEASRYIAGTAAYDFGLKGPKISGATELSALNTECNGPVNSVEICRTLDVFAGASGSITPPGGLFSISVTAGIKGTVKTCATVTNGILTFKGEFCGESDISLTYTLGGAVARTLRPQGYKVTGCITIFEESVPLPGS